MGQHVVVDSRNIVIRTVAIIMCTCFEGVKGRLHDR